MKHKNGLWFVSQYSDSDSEAEFSPVMRLPVPSAVPVTGESYCGCDSQADSSYNPRLRGFHQVKDCHCGEDDQGTTLVVFYLNQIVGVRAGRYSPKKFSDFFMPNSVFDFN